jgi:hypothetical protein
MARMNRTQKLAMLLLLTGVRAVRVRDRPARTPAEITERDEPPCCRTQQGGYPLSQAFRGTRRSGGENSNALKLGRANSGYTDGRL